MPNFNQIDMEDKKMNKIAVAQILIEELFGVYSYVLPNQSGTEIEKLLIMYGDNGTGKTTILKLLFYLLSTRDKSGYKTRISETRFKKFIVRFKNGFEVGATRENSTCGTYTYYTAMNGDVLNSVVLKANPNNAIQLEPDSKEDVIFKQILEEIKKLNITTFYLSDDRKILNSETSANDITIRDSQRILINESDIIFSKGIERNEIKKLLNERRLELESTIERLIDWIRNRVIAGSRMGEKNSQVVFSDIIKNYITLSEANSVIKDKAALAKELDVLENRIPKFVEFGLIEGFDAKTIRSSIKKAKTGEQERFLSTIISPFLESVNAKLEALEPVCKVIEVFIQTINEYFTNKTINFHLSTGFSLKQMFDNESIDFNWLSSGEKQLLLLLINTITSADDATIFIIDEPEISLNIKWQRKLIKTLLALSHENNTQFIIATHSFEVLSAYKNSVSKLENQNVGC